MKYIKEELETLILVEKKSYGEIGRMYGVSDTYIKKISRKLGIVLEIRKKFTINHSKPNINICPECKINYTKKYKGQKHCGQKCAAFARKTKKYTHYLENQDLYCNVDQSLKFIKEHILNEQHCKCQICNNLNVWNDKLIIFILDHIDGDASNNKRNNLRLICPNCDSQLDTYKSKNRNSARKSRYVKNYK